jgi:glycosyltransferase involved in cell wall biosynthesis
MSENAAPSLAVVVPSFNEEANLPGCLTSLLETLATFPNPFEIIIVDDGSRDHSLEVAGRLAAQQPDRVRVIPHERNMGLGAALKTGFAAATTDFVTCCPADFPMTVEDWSPFGSALGETDVLVGCRVRREGYNPLMKFNSWLYPKLVSMMFGLRLRDVNWISVYRRALVERVEITQRGIPMLTEILVKLRDQGATFREVDCRMQVRKIGTPSAARLKVMWRTLTGLFRLWREYRAPVSAPAPVPTTAPSSAAQGASR